MGADGVATTWTDPQSPSWVNCTPRIVPLGNYAAAAIVTTSFLLGERDIRTVISDCRGFFEADEDDYSLGELALALRNYLQDEIYTREEGEKPCFEVIVSGYSRGESAEGRRHGELFILKWENAFGVVRAKYSRDDDFGTFYSRHQSKALDRFLYGLDDWMIASVLESRKALFDQAQNYIVEHFRQRGHSIPRSHHAPLPDIQTFNVLSLLADFRFGETSGETVKNVKEGAVWRLATAESHLSLDVAIEYCRFLMSCAHAVTNFTFDGPGIASDAQIVSVTQGEGVCVQRAWKADATALTLTSAGGD
jgi:hypothetical protein